MALIVVGFDGSECARLALKFAVEEAGLRKAKLRVVSAWEVPPSVFAGAGMVPVEQEVFESFRELARQNVHEALAEVRRLQPDLETEGRILESQPAQGLLQQARDAALIVVGSRGRGGFASLMLGSVSQQVVHHASCPVVVVRGTHP